MTCDMAVASGGLTTALLSDGGGITAAVEASRGMFEPIGRARAGGAGGSESEA